MFCSPAVTLRTFRWRYMQPESIKKEPCFVETRHGKAVQVEHIRLTLG